MISLFLTFTFGALGSFTPLKRWNIKTIDTFITGFSLILIFLFGYQITGVAKISNLWPFFGNALILSLASVLGSTLFSVPLFMLLEAVSRDTNDSSEHYDVSDTNSCGAFIGIAFFLIVLGMIVGALYGGIETAVPVYIILHSMVFFIGVQVARQLQKQKRIKGRQQFRFSAVHAIYLVGIPSSVIVGTIFFTSLAGLLLGMGWKDGALCGAPLGWQTLGGPVVQEFRGVRVGSLVFIVNFLRDCISLLIIPLLAMGKLPLLAITPGGVSSMDILLPSIVKTVGRRGLIPAVWIGACCSFWAPILLLIIKQFSL